MKLGPRFRTTAVLGAVAGAVFFATGVTGAIEVGVLAAIVIGGAAWFAAEKTWVVLREAFSEPGDDHTTNWLHDLSYAVLFKTGMFGVLAGAGVWAGYGDMRVLAAGAGIVVVSQIGAVIAERMEGRSIYENGKEEMSESGYGWMYDDDRGEWDDPQTVEINDD